MSMSDDVTGAEKAPVTRNAGRRRRQKSYRRRRREGYRCVTIEIHRFTIGKLDATAISRTAATACSLPRRWSCSLPTTCRHRSRCDHHLVARAIDAPRVLIVRLVATLKSRPKGDKYGGAGAGRNWLSVARPWGYAIQKGLTMSRSRRSSLKPMSSKALSLKLFKSAPA